MRIPLFDAHCDTIFECEARGLSLRRNNLHIDLERGAMYSPYNQIFAIYSRDDTMDESFKVDLPKETLKEMGFNLFHKLLDEIEKNRDIISLCTTKEESIKTAKEGKISAFIAVEGAELLGCSKKNLKLLYDKGLRFVNMCWNFDNDLCSSCAGVRQEGLTEKGREFVRYAQNLGVAVDMSHSSEKTFWDCAEIATKPLIAGHSNSKALCNHVRNLTDEQFLELVRQQGFVGINLYPTILNESSKASMSDIIRHIDHFLALGGEKILGFGGDLDGIGDMPAGMKDISLFAKIYEEMLRLNYKESLIQDLFYNNLLNLLERI